MSGIHTQTHTQTYIYISLSLHTMYSYHESGTFKINIRFKSLLLTLVTCGKKPVFQDVKLETAFPFLQLLISTKKQFASIHHLLLGIPNSSSSYCEGGFIFRHLRTNRIQGNRSL